MAELQERFRHWEDRRGLAAVGHLPMRDAQRAIMKSLGTMHQAMDLLDAVAVGLGQRAEIDPAGGDAHRLLYVRDRDRADALVPTPLLHLAFVSSSVVLGTFRNADPVRPADMPDGWKEGDPPWREPDLEPQLVPRGPRMRAGEITIAEGPSYVQVVYDERGRRKEGSESAADAFISARWAHERPYTIDSTGRPPTPLPIGLFCRADLDPRGHLPADFARMVLELDSWARCPGRVRVPTALPDRGICGAWLRGLHAIRKRLWEASLPEDACVAVADGFDGVAFATGPTVEAALSAWQDELFRAKPKPPKPSPPSGEPAPTEEPRTLQNDRGETIGMSTGTITIQGGGHGPDLPWPAAVPRNIPAAWIELPALPEVPSAWREAGFRRWVRLVGEHGNVSHAIVREEDACLTLVGEGILDLVDLDTLDAELREADAGERAMYEGIPDMPVPWEDERYKWAVLRYRCWDDGHQKRIPFTACGGSWGADFSPVALDGDALRWAATRIRRLR